MRIIKIIIAVVLTTTITGNIAGQIDYNDISEYYGFDEIEIIKSEWGIHNLRTADFNGDGRNDIAFVNNRKAKIEVLLQKKTIGPGETEVAVDPNDIDINALTPPTRFDKQSVPVSQKVFGFVCGDLNSDNMTDLAFYGEPKGLYVILQKPSEAEKPELQKLTWRTRKKIKIDDGLLSPRALVCADLNNDGADDLALAGRDKVYIILQKKDGSLAEPIEYPVTSMPLAVDVGDLNGDNINDLVLITTDSENPIHIRFGLKTGQLGPVMHLFIERSIAVMLYNLDETAGDEILTVDAESKRLNCYKYITENQEDADWPIRFYPLSTGEGDTKRDLVTGDFDGDGMIDVVISEPGSAELTLYKQLKKHGLAEPIKFPALADIESLSAADINGDGKEELAVLSVKEKVIGLSRFEDDRLSFPKPIDLTAEPLAMELANVDNDSSIDCVYVSKDVNDVRSMSIIYNISAHSDSKTKNVKEKDQSTTTVELKKLTTNPDGLKVLDVDHDGLQDVLIFVKYELPILIRQTKNKTFEVVDSPKTQMSLIKDASLSSIAVANVDGRKGDELLVAQKNFARSLILAGDDRETLAWSIVDQYNAKSKENKVSAVAAFDINGGGKKNRPEILLLDGQKGQLQILTAGDDNTYRFEKEMDVSKWNAAAHLKILSSPLTGDKAKSILLFDSEKFALISPPTRDGTMRLLEQQFSYETKIKDAAYGSFIAGDINSDARAEIIMVEFLRNHIEILALDSQFTPIPAMRFKVFEQKSYRDSNKRGKITVEPRELEIADVTGDGKNDLVTVIHDRIIIYPQD